MDENDKNCTDNTKEITKKCEKLLLDEINLSGYDENFDYQIDYPKRGICYIFNHEKFIPYRKGFDRIGTERDRYQLRCLFKDLKFDIKVYDDLTVRKVQKKLKKAGEKDYSDYGCVVCCVLTHGCTGILWAKDGIYPTQDLFSAFKDDACHSLIGKPRIFLIQACQGGEFDDGMNVIFKESSDSFGDKNYVWTHPDFLIAYSSIPGHYSWRNTAHGSWFIQSLCAVLKKYAGDKDLLQILTIVNRMVAVYFESDTEDSKTTKKKQVPFVVSTLLKNMKFLLS